MIGGIGMKFLVDLEGIEKYIEENKDLIAENWVQIASSNYEGYSIAITIEEDDEGSFIDLAVFEEGEVYEEWGGISDSEEFFNSLEEAVSLLTTLDEVDRSRDIEYSAFNEKFYGLLVELGIDQAYWDNIENDFIATLELYDYNII